METFLIKALQLVVALVILVTIHEFGHYIFARIFGVKVNRFYIFFNPWFSLLKYYPDKGKLEIIAWTKKIKKGMGESATVEEEPKALFTVKAGKPHNPVNKKGKPSWAATMYGLGWLPLGGYCDIAGMIDETKSAADLEAEPQAWEFRTQSVWKRFMVMVAGVLFNFLLAIIIYAGIAFHWGDRSVPYQQAYEGMDFSQPMHEAGLQDGDILLSVDGTPASIRNSQLMMDMVQPGAKITVLRNHADTVTVTIPDKTMEQLAALEKDGWVMRYRVPVFIEDVQNGMPAVEAGLKAGDRIVKLGNDTTPSMREFYAALEKHPSKKITVSVLRDGQLLSMPVTPDENAKLGIMISPADKVYPFEEVKYSLFQSLPRGWEIGTETLTSYVSSLRLLFTKTGAQQVGGFGTLGQLFPDTWNWYNFWQITAFLSVILAFMNIIPIPGLDGGHVLFLLVEMVTRRRLPDKFIEVANTVGFVFLLLLLVYANGNDLFRFLK